MAKVSGSYSSVTRGVSEQVPQDRRPGQNYEQVNMISDPVRGLARRHGSLLQDEKVLHGYVEATHNNWLNSTARHRVFTFFVDGVEYDLLYRTEADTYSLGAPAFAFAFNKDARTIVPVVLTADASALVSGGVSAAVNVGKYIFLGGNSIVPGYTGVDKWGATANRQKMAVWIREGGYSRTYGITLTKASDNTKVTVTYKTKSSSYPTLINTADLLTTDPQYQNKLNQRISEYNSLVTEWIGLAAADITPQNIASKLATALTTAGVTGAGSVGGTVTIDNTLYKEVSAEDGSDGTTVRAVGAEVSNIDLVSTVHYPGKIVRIRPKKNNGEDTLYLAAIPKEGTGSTWGEVTWKEVAGYEMTPTAPFCIGTVHAGTLHIAGTPASLATATGQPVPTFKTNQVGDDITSPLPYFVDKRIDYLGLFQDRLVVGSGAVLMFSRPGDYFNWFRGSVLSVLETDPVEMFALGSEDDTIKASTTYDKNLVLFGKRNQYAINGRAPVSLKNPIFVMSSHEDAVDALPVSSGNFVFYAKTRNGISSAHQIQVGSLADSPESFAISQQLDRYIKGKPVELLAVTSPNAVLLRTDTQRHTLYTYAYFDSAGGAERVFDSWSRWEWDAALGSIIGLSRHEGDILVYVLRNGKDKDGALKVWLACDRFVLDTGVSPRPYADSLRLTQDILTPTANSFVNPESDLSDITYVAFGAEYPDKQFIGTDMTRVAEFVEQYPTAPVQTWAGTHYDSYVIPTNPYMRDQNGNVIVVGRLTIGRFNVTVADTAGMTVQVVTANAAAITTDFSGRLLGRASNIVGQQPVVNTAVTASVGKETREFKYTIAAKSFLPLTITAIEWVGQYFNNARRV
jgi:hypothetical protein